MAPACLFGTWLAVMIGSLLRGAFPKGQSLALYQRLLRNHNSFFSTQLWLCCSLETPTTWVPCGPSLPSIDLTPVFSEAS
jgi:hypothetical protein